MSKKIIDIHSIVDPTSIDYYNYMINSHNKLSSSEYELRYFAYCLRINSNHPVIRGNKNIFKHYVLDHKSIKSQGHGDAITDAVRNASKRMKEKLCTYSVFADTDTAICLNNWDLHIEKLVEKHGIVGTKYEDIGMPCAGSGKIQVYKNTPNCTWFALSPKYDYEGIELYARNNPKHNRIIDSDELSELYKLPIGYVINFDTGWQWAKFCKDNKINYYVFENGNPLVDRTPEGNVLNVLVAPAFNVKQIPKHVAQYPEEHMLHDGRTFLVHQRGSCKHKFRENEHSVHFYNAYEYFLKKESSNE